jgi:homoserine kinase
MPKSVAVRVPATSANLGPGFDCLGLALDLWGTITVAFADGRPAGGEDSMGRMALAAARKVLEAAGLDSKRQFVADYEGSIPIARGLGASAVARVGGALAANELAGARLDREALLSIAAALEGHADNATPAMFGGLQVSVMDRDAVLHARVPLPAGLSAVLLVPDLYMPTKESRKLLPATLSRADAVHNAGRSALLVAAMASGRLDLLDAATQDRLHQKPRSKLFPAMFAIFDAAKQAGALAVYLSGGGSTICALATENQGRIAEAMLRAARQRETPGRTIITRPTEKGAEVIG